MVKRWFSTASQQRGGIAWLCWRPCVDRMTDSGQDRTGHRANNAGQLVGFPKRSLGREKRARGKENKVGYPPDASASQSKELDQSQHRVAQVEPVCAQKPESERECNGRGEPVALGAPTGTWAGGKVLGACARHAVQNKTPVRRHRRRISHLPVCRTRSRRSTDRMRRRQRLARRRLSFHPYDHEQEWEDEQRNECDHPNTAAHGFTFFVEKSTCGR